MANQEKEVIDFGIGVDIRDALKAIEKYQRQMAKSMKAVAKSGEKMGKGAGAAAKKAARDTEGLADAIGGVGKAYEEGEKQASNLAETIRHLSGLAKQAEGSERKNLLAQIKGLKQVEAQRKKVGGAGGNGPPQKGGLFFGRFTPEKVKKELSEAGEALKEPLQAFLSRDLKGVISGSVKGAGAVLSRSLRASRALTGMGAEALGKRGEKASIKGKAMGGARGLATSAAGAGMKGVALGMKGIGGLISVLSKIGAGLSLVGGAVVGLISKFIDADSMVKEFNKDIMQSASNLEIFERSGRNAELASHQLEDTLSQLRAAAYDYTTNLAYGITKDDHKAMLNTLNQEGVSLGRIEDEAALAGTSVRDLATQLTVTGVAYSRAFGVPIAEIGQLQAEMMTEMGRSLGETQGAFALMTRGATESGIASSKFFATIRSFSQDLGLYNLRLEDTVALLGKLGKVMSPKNAQKFMQTVSQGLKSKGRQEKLQLSFFAGDKNVKAIGDRDIKRKTDTMIAKLVKEGGANEGEVRAAFEAKGYEGIKGAIEKLPKEMQGTMAQSAIQLELQKSKASKGMYGRSSAISDLDIGASMEVQRKALLTDFNGRMKTDYKSLSEAVGDLRFESVADSLGYSPETVDQFAVMEKAMEEQRKSLLAAPGADQAKIKSMGWDELGATMTDELKKTLGIGGPEETQADKMLVLAQKQGQLTQSLSDKLQVLVDWFMNQFYEVVMGIWESIMSLPGFGDDAQRDRLAAMRRAKEHGSAELSGIASSGDLSGGLANSKIMQDFLKAVQSRQGLANKGHTQDQAIKMLEQELSSTDTADPEYKVLEKQLEEAQAARAATQATLDGINEMVKQATAFDPDALADALTMDTGFSFGGGRNNEGLKNRAKFKEDVEKYGYETAARKAGATSEQATTGLGKLAFTKQSGGRKVDNFGKVGKSLQNLGLGGGGAAAPAAATPIGEVAASTTESAATLSTVAASNEKVQQALTQDGIKIDPTTAKEMASESEKAMLSALRIALFEFYLYSGTDRGAMLGAMAKGNVSDPRAVAQLFSGGSMAGGSTHSGLGAIAEVGKATANAAGGVVTGIANGMAIVAARGEGLASVGRGEKIVPAGGGGGVNVMVNGVGGRDLANLIESKVIEGIRDYKRRERLY